MRIERGTGSTGKSENSHNQREMTTEHRASLASSLERKDAPAVRLPYLRFLDPAHQRVKTS